MNLPSLIIIWLLALAGCASPDRAELTPALVIPQSVWQQVDKDIVAASRGATEQAQQHALAAMEHWMDLVYQRTDSDFIPWFSSYWTRQWLTMKVAWYKLNAKGEEDSSANRLALYLQEQYQERVLEPVAKELDPELIMAQTTRFYVQQLAERLQRIPQRYGVPQDQFDQRLKDIPAITLAPPAARASLHQLVHADPLDRLPAYAALLARVRDSPGGAGAWLAAGISSVAQQTGKTLETELTTRSVASSISAVLGRIAGAVLSLGVAGFSAIASENERPAMEAQLRKNLNAAFDEKWLDLLRNPDSGVLAGVYYLSGQIEAGLANSTRLPAQLEPLPRAIPQPDEQRFQNGRGVYDAPDDEWNATH